ncbi:MAG: hypothetical protein IJ144_04070 [Prevotella sp.]|nr:hypothetical protein [Prevotella sp.]MBQ9186988.1 hypothetical protein [Prevotella sp.]
MKKAIILTLLSVLTLGTRAADYEYLVFTLNDGTTQAVTALNLAISVDNDNLTVSDNNGTQLASFVLAELAKMEFSNDGGTSTGISTLSADKLTTDEATVIYDLNGRQMPRNAQLPQGVYILKNNNRTIKVQIK